MPNPNGLWPIGVLECTQLAETARDCARRKVRPDGGGGRGGGEGRKEALFSSYCFCFIVGWRRINLLVLEEYLWVVGFDLLPLTWLVIYIYLYT